MKYNTVIFDLDGTLLYTIEDLSDSTNYALHSHGLPKRSLSEITSFVGNGVRRLIERAVPTGTSKENTDAVFLDFQSYYKEHMRDKTRPYDGIMELLEELKKRQFKTVIVSNKYDAAVKQLKDDYFKGLITEAIGESPTIPKKPAPDGVFTAIQQLGSNLDSCVYVGDSDVDILTAKNANITSVGVTWGFRSRECLQLAGADHIIDHPLELLHLLNV